MTMDVPQTAVNSAMAIGIPGQLADFQSNADAVVDTGTSEETSANIPFGVFVQHGTADDGVLLISGAGPDLAGIVVHSHSFERLTELADDGLKPGATFGVLKKGRVFVTVNTDVLMTDEVHVQTVADTGKTVGSVGKAADTGKSTDISGLARWKRSALAGEIAVLEIDMTNIGLATAD